MRNNFGAAEVSYGSSAAMDAVYMLGCSVAMSGPRPCSGMPDPSAGLAPAHGLHLHARVWTRSSRAALRDSLSSQVSATRSRPKLW